jgi:hypothetical protein
MSTSIIDAVKINRRSPLEQTKIDSLIVDLYESSKSMENLIIQNIDDAIIKALEERAKRHGVSI